jgi:dTDP-4-amino-4,6-dideoxygalactose transaminase
MAKLVGAHPVFVDVLPDTYNLDPADLERHIEDCLRAGGRPKAIVPVHEFGLAAAMEPILATAKRRALTVIEDAACAFGARYQGRHVGTLGALGIFSFHPRKSITTGEGGAIVTNDDQLANRCRQWRNHGQQVVGEQRDFVVPGLNYRMTEIQAAIGQVQLEKLDAILASRRKSVEVYIGTLQHCAALRLPAAPAGHTWQTFMIVLEEKIERRALCEFLRAHGIEAGPGSVAGHLAAHFQPQPKLPVSERLHRQGLALPLHTSLESSAVQRISQALLRFLDQAVLNSAATRPPQPVA